MRKGGMEVAGRIIEDIVREKSLFRPRDVEARRISRSWLPMMVFLGDVQRVAPGIYGHPGVVYPLAAIAAVKTPRGIACLTTALCIHGWSDVPAREVWWAIPRSVRKPKRTPIPMRFLRLGPASFERDVESHVIKGVTVRVYTLERTLRDCWRWKRKVFPDTRSPWWQRIEREYAQLPP